MAFGAIGCWVGRLAHPLYQCIPGPAHPWDSSAPGHPDARLHHQSSPSPALALPLLNLTLVIGP